MNLFQTMMDWLRSFLSNVFGWLGAMIGALISWWTGFPALGKAVLIVQCVDVATGLACAWLGKSQKSESGKISSRVMLEGIVKKGAEWAMVLVCIYTGSPLGIEGISTAAMTYVIATELVSLLENLSLLGLDVPLLRTILDVAQGGKARTGDKRQSMEGEKEE